MPIIHKILQHSIILCKSVGKKLPKRNFFANKVQLIQTQKIYVFYLRGNTV